jgi:antitoxin HicB
LLEEPEGVTVTCPDVPEMVTCGRTVAEALDAAIDALVTALSFYTDADRRLPAPSRAHGRHVVAVPALAAAKLALHEAMVRGGVSNVELGRRLGTDEKAVRRLRDPLHGSKIEAVEAALRALGKRLEVSVREVA